MNLFKKISSEKQRALQLAHKACEYGWISPEHEAEFIEKINNDVLTLAVIGQMKCGKSTFLNAFVFGDEVLPAAITPMTAALSVITYGPEKKIVAEFYTPDEWAEQQMLASRTIASACGNLLEENKIQTAKELVAAASRMGDSLQSLLGTSREDSHENLVEYVGRDGRYVAITKAVTIYCPNDDLRGVKIVDTPGFNDPIVSREQRTKDFLHQADVVLMLIYAGRPYDLTDHEILFKNVSYCGAGRVLIGINKADIQLADGKTAAEIEGTVVRELKEACRAHSENAIVDLLNDLKPIALSAHMALLAKMPMSKIQCSPIHSERWAMLLDKFDIHTQSDALSHSRFEVLEQAVLDTIRRDKMEILVAKPINAIKGAALRKKADLETEISRLQKLVADLNIPDDELEERRRHLEKARKRIGRRIDDLKSEMRSKLEKFVSKGRRNLEDIVSASFNRMNNIIDGLGLFQNPQNLLPKLVREEQSLYSTKLRREVENLGEEARRVVSGLVDEFCDGELRTVIERHVDDFDAEHFLHMVKNAVKFAIDDEDLFKLDDSPEEDEEGGGGFFGFLGGLLARFGEIIDTFSLGSLSAIGNALNHNKMKSALKEILNNYESKFNPQPYLDTVFGNADAVIAKIEKMTLAELVDPLEKSLQEIIDNRTNREAALHKAQSDLAEKTAALNTLQTQITELLG